MVQLTEAALCRIRARTPGRFRPSGRPAPARVILAVVLMGGITMRNLLNGQKRRPKLPPNGRRQIRPPACPLSIPAAVSMPAAFPRGPTAGDRRELPRRRSCTVSARGRHLSGGGTQGAVGGDGPWGPPKGGRVLAFSFPGDGPRLPPCAASRRAHTTPRGPEFGPGAEPPQRDGPLPQALGRRRQGRRTPTVVIRKVLAQLAF